MTLTGNRVAFLATDGFEDSELTSPWEAVTTEGASATLIAPDGAAITGKNGHEQAVDLKAADASADQFDALVLPGGTINADTLRIDTDAQKFVTAFFEADKPVASICHGPWILIEVGQVKGRRMTSFESISSDLKNAGADWVDEQCVVDGNLITSRNPGDLEAFSSKLVEMVAGK